MKYITKSRLLQFIQCPKLGWISHHNSKSIPKPDLAQQRIFKQGHEVGFKAQERYPEGVLVEAKAYETELALKQTEALLKQNKTMFEGAFVFNGLLVRVDILNWVGDGYELVEVKSSTSVKEEHEWDIAIQYYVLSKLNIPIKGCKVLYINKQAEQGGDIFSQWEGYLSTQLLSAGVEEILENYKKVLELKEPNVDLGKQCDEPYECPLKEHCHKQKQIPEVSVLNVPRLGAKKYEYVKRGLVELKDLPVEEFNSTQRRMIESHVKGENFADKTLIFKTLNSLQYPLYYLDFETEQKAIPRLPKTRPYQQVVFQFSLHKETKDGQISWSEYLADSPEDHREQLLKSILEIVYEGGTLVSYNAPFEVSRLKELALLFPEHAPAIEKLIGQVFDLLQLTREALYYQDFKGSFSIKNVAPAILGQEASYGQLDVQNGIEAQEIFDQILEETNPQKKEVLLSQLSTYCKQDTWLMVLMVRHLRELAVS